jgi:hypothetical protein
MKFNLDKLNTFLDLNGSNITSKSSNDEFVYALVLLLTTVLPAVLFSSITLVAILCQRLRPLHLRLVLTNILSLELFVAFGLIAGFIMAVIKCKIPLEISGKSTVLKNFCPVVIWILFSGETAGMFSIATAGVVVLLYIRWGEMRVNKCQFIVALLSITVVIWILCTPILTGKQMMVEQQFCFPNLKEPKNRSSHTKNIAAFVLLSVLIGVPFVVSVFNTILLTCYVTIASKQDYVSLDSIRYERRMVKVAIFLFVSTVFKCVGTVMLLVAAATYQDLPKMAMVYIVLTSISAGLWASPVIILAFDKDTRKQLGCC